ncbi:calcium-binding protein [Pararhizobium sp. BT-229]|uniref:calcium-binding protein n=1 Tax=Pararhizobium sp. BT-229 TaxID=2986923 RepID=UPI0021F751CA|nr:calcium-binding protein [Pararhizobium sp. BT-229]MCV9960709.1 calcium-binding protein [Pararhizobium sp. BT-229]
MATIYGTNGYDRIVQNGYSAVDIYAYDGDDDIYLNRTDSLGGNNFVDAGYGDDYVLNYFEGGNDIFLGYGNDFYKADIRAGVSGEYDIVAGGAGDDRFQVNSFESIYKGESGYDTFMSVGYNNTFNGGSGVDTISYQLQDDYSAERGRGVTINLGTQKASTATGRLEDVISIENATGTNYGDDDITGSSVGNVLKGLAGNDILEGLAGDDDLYGSAGDDDLLGGSGADILIGGTGYDYLNGGTGADTFDFNSLSESVVGSRRDGIADFHRSEFDVVDLRTIDANELSSGNQAFSFIGGQAFHGVAGELRFAVGIIAGDTDGDGASDFQIKTAGLTRMYSDDFLV